MSSGILSGISSGIHLAYLLAFYLTYLLAFNLAVEVQRCALSWEGPSWQSRSGSGCRDRRRGGGGGGGGGEGGRRRRRRRTTLIKSNNPQLAGGETGHCHAPASQGCQAKIMDSRTRICSVHLRTTWRFETSRCLGSATDGEANALGKWWEEESGQKRSAAKQAIAVVKSRWWRWNICQILAKVWINYCM